MNGSDNDGGTASIIAEMCDVDLTSSLFDLIIMLFFIQQLNHFHDIR